jgi:hypothetical protein
VARADLIARTELLLRPQRGDVVGVRRQPRLEHARQLWPALERVEPRRQVWRSRRFPARVGQHERRRVGGEIAGQAPRVHHAEVDQDRGVAVDRAHVVRRVVHARRVGLAPARRHEGARIFVAPLQDHGRPGDVVCVVPERAVDTDLELLDGLALRRGGADHRIPRRQVKRGMTVRIDLDGRGSDRDDHRPRQAVDGEHGRGAGQAARRHDEGKDRGGDGEPRDGGDDSVGGLEPIPPAERQLARPLRARDQRRVLVR